MSPRNSAIETSASVSLSVPVMSDGQEQVLMAAIPKVLTMPSACSDASTNVFMVSISASSHVGVRYHRHHWLNWPPNIVQYMLMGPWFSTPCW